VRTIPDTSISVLKTKDSIEYSAPLGYLKGAMKGGNLSG